MVRMDMAARVIVVELGTTSIRFGVHTRDRKSGYSGTRACIIVFPVL